MFNLKTKMLQYVSRYKLHPAKYEAGIKDIALYCCAGLNETACSNLTGLVGLKPLTIAFPVSIENNESIQTILVKKNERLLSRINLIKSQVQLPGFVFYHITRTENYLQTGFEKIAGTVGIYIKNKLQPNKNFIMQPKYIKQLFDFCVYPRPVYILSGFKPEEKLSFPIDVIGIYPEGKILFSIRKSNRSNTDIQSRKKILLSRAPYDEIASVYSLGKNNFSFGKPVLSDYEKFNDLYYPSFAFDVMEITVESFVIIGEHYCYYGRITNRLPSSGKEQLIHLPWFALGLLK